MSKSVELPIQDCDLKVTVGRDGVWLHFGQYTILHVDNALNKPGIVGGNIHNWVRAREAQAKLIPGEMG